MCDAPPAWAFMWVRNALFQMTYARSSRLKKTLGDRAMAHFWIWWILAALLIGLELATGTFYLLAVGIAFGLGGVAVWIGAPLPMQMIIVGALSAIALFVAHYSRKRIAVPPS